MIGLAIAAGCRSQSNDPNRPLIWGADAQGGAPYIFSEGGKDVGFEVELAAALSKELGRPIEFKQYDFSNLANGVLRGDIDLAMNGLEVTEDRKKVLRFSRPYYIYRQQLVVRADDERFKSLEDLKGKKDVTVGTLANTAASRLLEKHGIPVKTYEDQVNPYKDLALKDRVDAVLLDYPIALWVVKKNPDLDKALKFAGPPIEPGQYAIGFDPKNEALAKQVDDALGRLIQKGELKKILEKWELWNDEQKELK
jgi:polar amino acid transport system substrate-binding protein